MTDTDLQLLGRYARERAEDAFAEPGEEFGLKFSPLLPIINGWLA